MWSGRSGVFNRSFIRVSCFFHAFPPHKGVPSRTAFQLGAVQEHRFVVCFPPLPPACGQTGRTGPPLLPLQRPVRNRASVLWSGAFRSSSKPSEVDAVLTGLLQLAAGIDPAQIAVDQYLEQHPGLRRRFSPFGRIRFVQFPVLQFLKLGA